jgi:hypothetical protein
MTLLFVAIALGHTNLNVPSIYKHLGRYHSEKRFHIERRCYWPPPSYSYKEGTEAAEDMAVSLADKLGAPISVGVVMIRYRPRVAGLSPAWMDIAVIMEKGELREPIHLTPHTTQNVMIGHRQCETYFNYEGCSNLGEFLRTRQLALNLV